MGVGLHGLGLALHVHDADPTMLRLRQLQQGLHGGIPKAGDIINKVNAQIKRLTDHLGPTTVK